MPNGTPFLRYGFVPPPQPPMPLPKPPPKSVAIQTDVQIVGRSGFPFEDADFDSPSVADLFQISTEVQTIFGRHVCRHALAWMMDTSVFGSPEEQLKRTFTMKDLPGFLSHLCSRSEELESERELTSYYGSRFDQLDSRLELARRTTPAIASLFDDGGEYDLRVRHEFEELVARQAAKKAQNQANTL